MIITFDLKINIFAIQVPANTITTTPVPQKLPNCTEMHAQNNCPSPVSSVTSSRTSPLPTIENTIQNMSQPVTNGPSPEIKVHYQRI